MFFSIAIPTYEMKGRGSEFLEFNFNKFQSQSFKDFEVVISDHSQNNDIENLCNKWKNIININYIRNDYKRGSSSANINTCIKECKGKWIKILFQDDYLYNQDSLENLFKFIINNKFKWVATACDHTNDGVNLYRPFYPRWSNDLVFGNNTISSPSVISIENINDGIYFNEELIWLMDVEYYKKKYDIYGEPGYLQDINVINRTWGERLSDKIPLEVKQNELKIIKDKYGRGIF